MTLRYVDAVQPSTPWEVVLYVDDRAAPARHEALEAIFLGRAGGTVAQQYGRAIGEVHAGVAGYVTLEAQDPASEPGEVACGIPGLDRPGTELFNDVARSDDPLLRWEVRGRGASFATDFDYRSGRPRLAPWARPDRHPPSGARQRSRSASRRRAGASGSNPCSTANRAASARLDTPSLA
jgi:Protein of unknown function (DUF1326)